MTNVTPIRPTADMAPLEQLRAFVEWERTQNPDKHHIAAWALDEIERRQAELTRKPATIKVHDSIRGVVEVTKVFPGDVIAAEYAAPQAASGERVVLLGDAWEALSSKASFNDLERKAFRIPAAVDIEQFRVAVATHHLASRKRVRDCRAGLLPAANLPIYQSELAEAQRLLDLVDGAAPALNQDGLDG